jgi:hypothetical protein
MDSEDSLDLGDGVARFPAMARREGANLNPNFQHKPPSSCSAAVIIGSTLHFQEPRSHTEYAAVGVSPQSVLRCIQYNNCLPYPFVCGSLDRSADCKLGGVNSDVSEAVLVNLIQELTQDRVRVAAIDLFARQGLCRLWFTNGPNDFDLVKESIHSLVWMGPLKQHCAVVARRSDESQAVLDAFLAQNARTPVAFPRRTMTVEEWAPR